MAKQESEKGLSARSCNELIETACRIASVEELHALCSQFCDEAGFDYFLYGAVLPGSMVRPQTVIISGYPSDWWMHYQEKGYMSIDPVVQHTTSGQALPLVWNDINPDAHPESKMVRHFLQEAADFGLASGVSFPVHGQHGENAVLSFTSNASHAVAKPRIIEAMPYGQLLASYVHEAARRVFSSGSVMLERPILTERETECLLWAAEGKTSWDTAHILGISERTVQFHLRNAAHKLNVSNRAQAVARAVAQGHITPQF